MNNDKSLKFNDISGLASSSFNIGTDEERTHEVDTVDVKPRIENDVKDDGAPIHYLEWLSRPKINIIPDEREIGKTTDKKHHVNTIANAIAAGAAKSAKRQSSNRRMSSSNIATNNEMKVHKKGSCDANCMPFWNPPERTDMTTPQANMLFNLRGRLRSIVTLKPKQELLPSSNEGMRACKSYTNMNEENDALEGTNKAGMDKISFDTLTAISQPGSILSSTEKINQQNPGSNQISFHDLSSKNTTFMEARLSLMNGLKQFRTRAKSEASKREKIYKDNG